MKFVIALMCLAVACSAEYYEDTIHKLASQVNSHPARTWTAGFNEYFRGKSAAFMKSLHGAKMDKQPTPSLTKPKAEVRDALPQSFDARTQWGNCRSVSTIRDQANCGSCWAFAAAEVASDRTCIASQGAQQPYLSEENILSCCSYCGGGCGGGYPIDAMAYWVYHGIPTGGAYGTYQGCQPYTIEPCSYPGANCNGGEVGTPACQATCESSYSTAISNDEHFASSYYYVASDQASIMTEIMSHGPVECAFTVYADFYNYQTGVYQHTTGAEEGGHAIRVLGWGVENNTPYWLVANSWNASWGEQGYFKILRGNNECGIESQCVAGIPK